MTTATLLVTGFFSAMTRSHLMAAKAIMALQYQHH